MTTGIYSITSIESGKIYVGRSVAIERRWGDHLRNLYLGQHENKHLQNIYNKYGIRNLNFRVLEVCSEDALAQKEVYWYNELSPEINQMYPDDLSSATEMPILKLHNLTGEVICEYQSIRAAARAEDCAMSLLWTAIHEGRRTALGHVWVFKDTYDPITFTPVKPNRMYAKMKAVQQLDIDTGEVLRTFACAKDAADEMGVSNSAIKRAIRREKTSAGYAWRFDPANFVSSYKGVSYEARRSKWRARTVVDGKQVHLGYFNSERQAQTAIYKYRRENIQEVA